MSENVQPLTDEQKKAYEVIAALAIEEGNKRARLLEKEFSEFELFEAKTGEKAAYITGNGPFSFQGSTTFGGVAFQCKQFTYSPSETQIQISITGSGTYTGNSNFGFLRQLSGPTLYPSQLLTYGSGSFTLYIGVDKTSLTIMNGSLTLAILNGPGNPLFSTPLTVTGTAYIKQVS
ncbi:hypothetical protein [Burkholderia ubonensis]|uniref:hypothetical protein n=1 Tax=Burkholderia ubonensis TaxID=101571 RepID=UPI0011603065|nr:hypothetical protein [Burkholderia ubonensis]